MLIGLIGSATAADQIAFNGPHAVPGQIQAEDYDNGGANVAYYDTTAGNAGGSGRLNEGVDVETANGITNIGWIINNEWTDTRSPSPRAAPIPRTSASARGPTIARLH